MRLVTLLISTMCKGFSPDCVAAHNKRFFEVSAITIHGGYPSQTSRLRIILSAGVSN